jgi:hypothetical protein
MTRPSYKEVVTQKIIKELDIDGPTWTLDEAMKKWWMIQRLDGGLRLTDIGDLSFRYAKIEFYNYDFVIDSNNGWHSYLLELNKKLKCPYYIGVNKVVDSKKPFIRLYDSKIAMLVSLYGNISDYLKSVKVQNDRRKEK